MQLVNQLKICVAASVMFVSGNLLAQETGDAQTPPLEKPSYNKQYGFLIGNWDCTYVQYSNKEESKGEVAAEYPCDWNARYTFDGSMVQDDFRMFYQDQVVFSGTTLRTWVEGKNRWDLAFLASRIGHWPNFQGTWQEPNMEITASGTDPQGEFVSKIRFTDIQTNSFLWEMVKSYDAGKTWHLDAQIKTVRKKP